MTPLTGLREATRIISEKEKFVFTTHKGMDADGLGSELALFRFLSGQRGKKGWLINCDPPPRECEFLLKGDPVYSYEPSRDDEILMNADVICLFDISNFERLDRMARIIEASPAVKIRVDHHPQEDGFVDINVADEQAPATGQLVYEIITAMEGGIDASIAEPIYASIVTDTGSFRFMRTNPKTHRIASELLDTGIDHHLIHHHLFESCPVERLRVLGETLANLELHGGDRILVLSITQDMLQRHNAPPSLGEDLANYTLMAEGVEIGLVLRELEDGKGTKVSLRSQGNVAVNKLAASFGGGGHAFAAGIQTDEPMEVLKQRILKAAVPMLPGA